MLVEKKRTFTYEDYIKLPEGAPFQLIDGMLVKSPSPVPYHQELTGRLYLYFAELEKHGKGKVYFAPIDVFLSNTETYQPDLIFICSNHLEIIGDKKIEGAPDISVEVLSPSNAYYDLRHKMKIYERYGVREYWIVDPMEKTVEVYVNGEAGFSILVKVEGNGRVASYIFPELSFEINDLFSVS